ncbi:hypothetical protein DL771_000720 [Monosporascus sp. 5C6A]|nr:hypothetical protein DL771_000720 [Monosporascus sp. 5C6A]
MATSRGWRDRGPRRTNQLNRPKNTDERPLWRIVVDLFRCVPRDLFTYGLTMHIKAGEEKIQDAGGNELPDLNMEGLLLQPPPAPGLPSRLARGHVPSAPPRHGGACHAAMEAVRAKGSMRSAADDVQRLLFLLEKDFRNLWRGAPQPGTSRGQLSGSEASGPEQPFEEQRRAGSLLAKRLLLSVASLEAESRLGKEPAHSKSVSREPIGEAPAPNKAVSVEPVNNVVPVNRLADSGDSPRALSKS